MSRIASLLLLAVLSVPASALPPAETARMARDYRIQHEQNILDEFTQFLSIPNLASDRVNIERNASAVVEMFTRRGASTKLLRIEGAPPVVVATIPASGAKTTTLSMPITTASRSIPLNGPRRLGSR